MIPSTARTRDAGYPGDVSLGERARFWRQFRRQYSTIGAVTPSSRYLAAAMVRPLRRHRRTGSAEPLRVVEMGSGTGAVTREIARLMRPGDSLDCYEIDDGLASYLQRRVASDQLFDAVRGRVRVHVMPAQAARLDGVAQFVICSVPLNNLAPGAVRDIFGTSDRLLGGGGWFTYFEYIGLPALKRRLSGAAERRPLDGVQQVKREHRGGGAETQVVWANIPPARAVHRRGE